MAKISYVDILPELEEPYWGSLQPGDRFIVSRVRKKITFLSALRKRGVTLRSLLPQIAELWDAFSDDEKQAWFEAGKGCPALYGVAVFGFSLYGDKVGWGANLNGWRLFVQDQSLRIKNDLPGVAIPSLFHQSSVGVLQIDPPADELKIIQVHPEFYWISKKVKGKKGMYEPVLVTEELEPSVKISLNYRAELEEVNPPSFAKFYARFWFSFQGVNLYTDLEIPLDYISDWKSVEAVLTTLTGYAVGYDLYLHLKGLTGTLYIDNIKVEHSAQNWARDPFCKDINQGFTRAFYQVPKHWTGVIVPDGSWFESFYIDW